MNAGVAGLSAQSMNLSTISDNIANSATAGYKRATTDFATMVVGSGGGGAYVAGGVRAQPMRLIDSRGSLTTTTNATDIAIAGRGMLPVTSDAAVAGGAANLPFMMTSTGSFRPDADGYLRTPSGLVLLGVPVGADQAPPVFGRTTNDDLVPVRLPGNEVSGSPTTAMRVSANLPADATVAGATSGPENLSMTYYDNLGRSQSMTFNFTPVVPVAPAPPSNQWTLTITDSATGAAVGTYTLTFDNTAATGGRLLNVAETPPGATYVPATGVATIPAATGRGPIEITLGRPGEAGGFTQFDANFTPGTMTRDGAAAAALTGVEVDANGFVVASYDSGATRRLFQIPVVDVPNPNGLTALSNQTYVPSEASGAFVLWNAGEGPTGTMEGYAREESTVDVAQELTQLIKTQRAYSSNAKVIQTVDEMLQETTNIKR
jgi:flagellar hook protein FlgE